MNEEIEWHKDTEKMWQGLQLLDIVTKLKESEEATKHSIRCHNFVCHNHCCSKYHEWSLAEILEKLLEESQKPNEVDDS